MLMRACAKQTWNLFSSHIQEVWSKIAPGRSYRWGTCTGYRIAVAESFQFKKTKSLGITYYNDLYWCHQHGNTKAAYALLCHNSFCFVYCVLLCWVFESRLELNEHKKRINALEISAETEAPSRSSELLSDAMITNNSQRKFIFSLINW